MKKILFVLAFLVLACGLRAQCPPGVNDVSLTDCHDIEYNLNSILDQGQYVLVHIVTNMNSTSQTTAFIKLYHQFGCNGHELFFMEVLPTQNDSTCRLWEETQNAEFPVFGLDGGGHQFYSDFYDCFYYSGNNKYLLITPNHEIYQEPLGYHLEEELEDIGFVPSNCEWGEHSAPENLNASLIEGQFRLIWDKREGASYYHVYYRRRSWMDYNMMATTTDTCYQGVYIPYEDNHYYVVSCFEDGSEYISDTVSIGFEAPDFVAVDCNGNEIHLYDILDSGQYVFIDFFHYTCGPCRELMPFVEESYYYYGCNDKDVFYMEISSDNVSLCLQWSEEFGVEYPTISKEDGGGEIRSVYRIPGDPFFMLIAPDGSIVLSSWYNFAFDDFQSIVDAFVPFDIQVYQCYHDVEEENETNYELFPNPADTFVNLSVEGSSLVQIYNALGQLMDSFVVENQQAKIETGNYSEGLYFVQVNGQGFGKVVVRH